MTHEKMREMLSKDEKITIEYKECANQIHDSVYETVSAFSNRYGGYIIMGVKDGGIPIGVNRNAVKDLKKNFVNQLNNPNKMSPTLYLSIEEFEYEGMLLLYTYVPPTSTVEKCSGRVYDRNEEGDMDITDSPIQMENLYARKSNTYTESKLFPYVREEHLRTDLMEKVRRLISNNNPRHEWLKMSDKELLVSAGLYETDFVTGEQGYNLAAILLFGKDEVIQSCVPGYVTDALCRKENMDRYDDRLIVKTNLIESYEILMEFIAKHTSDKFYLVDNVRTSVRDLISREVVSNILVHRDFSSAFPAKVIIEKDWIRTENWCRPRRQGNILETEFTPYPKNPILARFFVAVGLADTIGSGVRNLYKYTPIYTPGGKPELIENDVFRINIPITETAVYEYAEENELTERETTIFKMIKANNKLTVEEVMAVLDISRATVFRDYAKIRKKCGVSYDKKAGEWKL
ncbi:MAG: putative DNA binding domain-containing protein [Schaedlerella sp.]